MRHSEQGVAEQHVVHIGLSMFKMDCSLGAHLLWVPGDVEVVVPGLCWNVAL